MKKKIKKIICAIIGHHWLYLDSLYSGDFEGKWCTRCDKEIGKRI